MTKLIKTNASGLTKSTIAALAAALMIAVAVPAALAQDSTPIAATPGAAINQPGKFPIKISKPGSYTLQSNLTVKTSSTDAIDVNVANVTIDLNGFTITGGAVGINGLTSGATNTAITNGTIIGSLAGVALSDGGIVRNVRVVSVTGSEATCGAIKCLDHCTITGNTADANTVCSPAGAITVGADALVTGNSVNDTTGGPGILAGSGAFISGNTVNSNSADGIEVVGAGALVAHNTASGNTIGLNFGANQGGYEDNVLTGNSSADTQGGTSLGGGNTNLCTAGVC